MIKFNLDKILEQKRMSISQLSQLTSISRPSLTAISNNTSRSVNLDFLEKIMLTLDVSLEEIITEVTSTLLTIISVEYAENYEYYKVIIKDKESDDIIFNNYLGLITKEQYNKETKELYDSLGYEKSQSEYLEDFDQLFYLTCNPLSPISDRQIKNIELLKLVDYIGKEQATSLLVKLISNSNYFSDFDTSKLLVINMICVPGFFYFGFSESHIVPIPLDTKDKKKYPKLEFSSFRRLKSKRID